jgi:GAF domain-containing protein
MGTIQTAQPEELHALFRAARAIMRYDTFEKSAREIFNEAKLLTGATAGYIALLSESGEENEVLFLDDGGSGCTIDPNLPMPIRGLRSQAYQECRAVMDNDFFNSEYYRFIPAGHAKLRNVMFAPLVIEGKTLGLMGLANKPVDFDEHDLEIAAALGEYAAIALNNSRTLDKLRETITELNLAISEIKTLQGIIPICAYCKSVRRDDGYWQKVEDYVTSRSSARFSHSICNDCVEKHFPKKPGIGRPQL